jgi:RNA polymerase sigma-70 factor (ECF subfamily)
VDLDDLLARCRGGDDLAWEALVRRYQGRIFALAYHYLGNREEAREAAQETFVRVYRKLDTFEGGSFVAWMVSIGRNCCIDRVRHLRARPALDGPPLDERLAAPDPTPGPEQATLAHERESLLYRALDRMSEINREMILLKDIQGLKQAEIAEALSLPLGTVKTRSHRARLELARCILELDPTFGG